MADLLDLTQHEGKTPKQIISDVQKQVQPEARRILDKLDTPIQILMILAYCLFIWGFMNSKSYIFAGVFAIMLLITLIRFGSQCYIKWKSNSTVIQGQMQKKEENTYLG